MSWDEPRCVWCHKTGGIIEPLCVRVPNVPIFSDKEQDIEVLVHAEHRDETRRYYARLYRYARVFLLAVLLGTMATLIFAVLGGIPGETAVVSYFGIVFVVFPFANGTTFEIVGIRDSVRFAQITGIVFILAGFALLYVAV